MNYPFYLRSVISFDFFNFKYQTIDINFVLFGEHHENSCKRNETFQIKTLYDAMQSWDDLVNDTSFLLGIEDSRCSNSLELYGSEKKSSLFDMCQKVYHNKSFQNKIYNWDCRYKDYFKFFKKTVFNEDDYYENIDYQNDIYLKCGEYLLYLKQEYEYLMNLAINDEFIKFIIEYVGTNTDDLKLLNLKHDKLLYNDIKIQKSFHDALKHKSFFDAMNQKPVDGETILNTIKYINWFARENVLYDVKKIIHLLYHQTAKNYIDISGQDHSRFLIKILNQFAINHNAVITKYISKKEESEHKCILFEETDYEMLSKVITNKY